MFYSSDGEECEKQVKTIPLSNNTIKRRIEDMSKDVETLVNEKQLIFCASSERIHRCNLEIQFIASVRFICESNVIEQFLFYKDLPENTTGLDIFQLVNSYFITTGLSWLFCLSICTGDCPGHLTGLLALVQMENPDIIFTHSFLHREALVAKSLMPELNVVFQT
ncbi:protein FAM200C-like [Diabrotica undecimpunctata]|uniref:protein FAM200C-like n=1 Tax=Diabrotica undecimpunctata TaxID=50387 RepID=UPI003B63DA6F